MAWAQGIGIAQIEVSIDDGPWRVATEGPDAGIDMWRQWSHTWDATPGEHRLAVRAPGQKRGPAAGHADATQVVAGVFRPIVPVAPPGQLRGVRWAVPAPRLVQLLSLGPAALRRLQEHRVEEELDVGSGEGGAVGPQPEDANLRGGDSFKLKW